MRRQTKMDKKILNEANILLNLKSEAKFEAIERAGKLLVEMGYVDEPYLIGMRKREEDITTYIGNGIAIPHGMNEFIKYINKSGIVVLQYPEGVDFGDGNIAYIVIGIAGKNNDHLDILSKIAIVCLDEANVQKLIASKDKNEIIDILTEEK
jgi:PTS system mannitol-specific IIA component